jgi:hypothetical protein
MRQFAQAADPGQLWGLMQKSGRKVCRLAASQQILGEIRTEASSFAQALYGVL